MIREVLGWFPGLRDIKQISKNLLITQLIQLIISLGISLLFPRGPMGPYGSLKTSPQFDGVCFELSSS